MFRPEDLNHPDAPAEQGVYQVRISDETGVVCKTATDLPSNSGKYTSVLSAPAITPGLLPEK